MSSQRYKDNPTSQWWDAQEHVGSDIGDDVGLRVHLSRGWLAPTASIAAIETWMVWMTERFKCHNRRLTVGANLT